MSEELTTEVLYYFAFHSFVLQRFDFKEKYEMLKDQYLQFPESFKIFSKPELLRIKKMQVSYKTNKFSLFEGFSLNLNESAPPRGEKSHKKHKDLCMEIWKRRESLLEPFTGTINSSCAEYPVTFGNIDLIVQNKKTVYIIEVKTETANHAIIGQMMKYYIGMCLKLIIKFYDDIKMITICPGYDQASFNGLKQIGVLPLIINTKTFKIKSIF